MLDSQALNTGIQISKDQVLDISAEVRARNVTAKVESMLDIIKGGDATMELLREIETSPKTAPIMLNKAPTLKKFVLVTSPDSLALAFHA